MYTNFQQTMNKFAPGFGLEEQNTVDNLGHFIFQNHLSREALSLAAGIKTTISMLYISQIPFACFREKLWNSACFDL